MASLVAAAFIVLHHFGIDSGSYSFDYLAGWSDAETFKRNVQTITRTADKLITAVKGQQS